MSAHHVEIKQTALLMGVSSDGKAGCCYGSTTVSPCGLWAEIEPPPPKKSTRAGLVLQGTEGGVHCTKT